MKKAFLFAGQGAQTPGMACELTGPRVKELFDAAERVHPGIRALMESGTPEALAVTANTQPCMFVADLAYAIDREEREGAPDAVCGFSVGEVPALCYAGALELEDGLKIIEKRAALMQKACEKTGGAMIAVIGLSPQEAEEIAEKTGAWAANYNAPKQTVLAVTNDRSDALKAAVAEKKGRAIPLKVSGAFHCPLLTEAAKEFETYLNTFTFKTPAIPVYANLTGRPYEGDSTQMAHTLAMQMCSPVRFTQTIANMKENGIEQYDEVGPGKVLTGLVAKIFG